MKVAALYRHPIKGIGTEPLAEVELVAGQTLPGDRAFAIAHEAAKLADAGWSHCNNFLRGAKSPRLMAVRARTDGACVTLTHPDQPDWSGHPLDDADSLIAWVQPLCDPGRAAPAKVIAAGPLGMTDDAVQGLSIMGTASLAALSDAAGKPLEQERFRGNIWLDGLDPWEERGWTGRLRIGRAVLELSNPINRCVATHVNTATGLRDTDVLDLLDRHFGHREMGMNAVVVEGGTVRVGDPAVRL